MSGWVKGRRGRCAALAEVFGCRCAPARLGSSLPLLRRPPQCQPPAPARTHQREEHEVAEAGVEVRLQLQLLHLPAAGRWGTQRSGSRAGWHDIRGRGRGSAKTQLQLLHLPAAGRSAARTAQGGSAASACGSHGRAPSCWIAARRAGAAPALRLAACCALSGAPQPTPARPPEVRVVDVAVHAEEALEDVAHLHGRVVVGWVGAGSTGMCPAGGVGLKRAGRCCEKQRRQWQQGATGRPAPVQPRNRVAARRTVAAKVGGKEPPKRCGKMAGLSSWRGAEGGQAAGGQMSRMVDAPQPPAVSVCCL